MKRISIVTTILLSVCLFVGSCQSAQDFDAQLSAIVKPYCFSIAGWEFETILDETKQLIFGGDGNVEEDTGVVLKYFSLTEQIKFLDSELAATTSDNGQDDLASLKAELTGLKEHKAALEETVERVIRKQIQESLAKQGIFNPLHEYIGLKITFPPLNFRLEKPPYLLVVSPRDRIESMREITLKQAITLEEMQEIEARVDGLGVSSLVVGLGGIATYPSFVTNDASLQFTVDTATEEWLHQYLAFKPLGFLYLLDSVGIYRNYDIATMNETVAGMVSKEIGSIICQEYHPDDEGEDDKLPEEPEFDFNREMREIRIAVDQYLAQGEIEQAEEFMEEKRQFLATKGYYIRKLNQAYFAFYGTYADSPTSVSPIRLEIKELRERSESLADFLDAAAAMTSPDDLTEALNMAANE